MPTSPHPWQRPGGRNTLVVLGLAASLGLTQTACRDEEEDSAPSASSVGDGPPEASSAALTSIGGDGSGSTSGQGEDQVESTQNADVSAASSSASSTSTEASSETTTESSSATGDDDCSQPYPLPPDDPNEPNCSEAWVLHTDQMCLAVDATDCLDLSRNLCYERCQPEEGCASPCRPYCVRMYLFYGGDLCGNRWEHVCWPSEEDIECPDPN